MWHTIYHCKMQLTWSRTCFLGLAWTADTCLACLAPGNDVAVCMRVLATAEGYTFSWPVSRTRQGMELRTRRRARWGSVDVLTINPSAGEEQRWRPRFGQEDGASRTRTPLLSWPWIGSRLQRTERRQTASTAVAGVLLSLVRSKTRGSAGLGQAGDDGNGDGERRSKI